jgi:Domain of unknown function (DUF4397)
MRKVMGLVLCGFILALGMTACLKNGDIAPQNSGGLSIYHSSPDAPDVNIIIDNEVINTEAFKYKNYSNYVDVQAGDRRIKFNSYSNGANFVDSTLSFEANKFYSLFMVNVVSKAEVIKTQDAGDFPSAGKAMVRFVHLSPDAPPVDINWQGETSLLFSGKAFKEVTVFQEVPAKTYIMEVKVKGGSGITLVVPDVLIKEAGFYTILLEGFDSPPVNNNNKLSARVVAN